MLIDLEDVCDTAFLLPAADVCIGGAGIAGLVLATTLADAGVRVTLLEGGGRRPEDRSQEIYDAEMAQTRHAGTTEGRFRVFGGSSVRWGGQLLPYTDDTLSPGEELLSCGWPIPLAAFESFYPMAEALFGADHLPFTKALYEVLGIDAPVFPDSGSGINLRFSKWAPFSHRNVARTLGQKAISSHRITVVLHANITECLLAACGSRIEGLSVRNYKGSTFRFSAARYVLATGTIETSRLLLASRSVSSDGVGNDRNQVGRGFHDHVSAAVAELTGQARKHFLSWLGPFFYNGTMHTGRLEASPDLRQRMNLLAVNAHLTIEEPEDSPGDLARQIIRSVQRENLRSILLERYKQIPAACLQLAQLAYNWKVLKRRAVSNHAIIRLHVASEQRACLNNRIRISATSRDPLGIPRAIVNWRVSSEEARSIRYYAEWLWHQFKSQGTPGVDWKLGDGSLNDGFFPVIRDTNHPMGGTIMGFNPAESVVNTDLRVHGISNLYIASCSAYPSGGSSNPTFTLVALTLRLAEHIKHLPSSSY